MKKLTILILIIWISIIFYFSGNSGTISHNQSVKFAHILMELNIIKSIFKNLKITDLDFFVRKNAHAFEYIVLAMISSNIFISFKRKGKAALIYILFTCLLLAVLDEYHQSFVPGRGSLVSDVLIDFIGALLGTLIYYFYYFVIYKKILRKGKLRRSY